MSKITENWLDTAAFAIAGHRKVKLLLVLNDAHNPINNPTVQIADLRKQNTLLLGNYTNDRRTSLHHDHGGQPEGATVSCALFQNGVDSRALFREWHL